MRQLLKKASFYGSVLLFGSLLGLGIGYVHAGWTEPSLPPPQGNISAPLNIGAISQYKEGGLLLGFGGPSVGLIVAGPTKVGIVVTGTVAIGVDKTFVDSIGGAWVPMTEKLLVNGQIKITGGNPREGSVLTSDATGLASWQSSASGGAMGTNDCYILNRPGRHGTFVAADGFYLKGTFSNTDDDSDNFTAMLCRTDPTIDIAQLPTANNLFLQCPWGFGRIKCKFLATEFNTYPGGAKAEYYSLPIPGTTTISNVFAVNPPALSATCSVQYRPAENIGLPPNPQPRRVIWTAAATGGIGGYLYTWSGAYNSPAEISNFSVQLNNPQIGTTLNERVTVRSNFQSVAISCPPFVVPFAL